MSTAAAFIPLIHGQLAELKKLCGNLFHRSIRDSIVSTENYIQHINSNSDQIDFKIALDPFFKAVRDDQKFLPTVLDCFYNVFHQSTKDFFLSRALTQSIITILIESNRGNSDEVNLRCCNVCIACLRSYSGIHFAHGKLLRKMFILLFQIYNDSENPNTLNSISTAIKESLTALFDSYLTPPEMPTGFKNVEELAKSATDGLLQNTLAISHYLEPVLKDGDYSASIRDVDVYVVLSLLSKIIYQNKMQLRTIKLASDFLVTSLKNNSSFYKTSTFNLLLKSKIHLAAMSLALDPRMPTQKATAELIIVLWENFAPIYFENLNELLVKGLCQALFSPEPGVLLRGLTIFDALTSKPQLFVDAFVNYDCDDTGYFKNTFEDTINRVVSISFPDSVQTEVQKLAVEVIVHVLKSLWVYFNNFQPSDNSKLEPEAPQSFLDAKKTKNVFNQGLDIFKGSWKKGLRYFFDHHFCEDNPASIAKFLFTTPALSAVMIGEVLGNVDKVDVLKEFLKLFDFKGVSFENAFRQFLSKFQIPGEAQMIDRVMEQFGTKYYNDNPKLFSCADTVYVLAFSTLMLHTDAHHPNVTSRMSLNEFIANNHGIDNGNDLPAEFLEELYNGITKQKIFVQATASNDVPSNSSLLNRRQRAEMFKAQCQNTLASARQRVVSTQLTKQFHKSESPLFIGPMFQAIWGGALGTLTMTFEQVNERKIYNFCLDGLTYAVHIASHCFIDEALDTLVDAFAKFTALRKSSNEIKTKNIDCTKALINIAIEDGNFLRNAWPIVLGEISAIDKIEQSNNEAFSKADDIFMNNSQLLDRESILDFVQAMCEVSRHELQENPPRMTMCQKLSIVAHHNLKREHFIWSKMWNIIGNYLKNIGSSFYFDIAVIVIDILKQLANKFLDQKELIDFHFQEHFMSPFSDIFEAQSDVKIKLLIISCVQQLIEVHAHSIHSGWTTIFGILNTATIIPETQKLCFETVTYLIDKLLPILSVHYVHLLTIVSSFVQRAPEELKLASVPLFTKISDHMIIKDDISEEEIDKWQTLFLSLEIASKVESPQVRNSAHVVLMTILQKSIPQKFVEVITTELLEIHLPQILVGGKEETKEFYSQTSPLLKQLYDEVILPNWNDYFIHYYSLFIKLFENCVLSGSLEMCNVGQSVLLSFVQDTYSSLSHEQHILMTECYNRIADSLFKSLFDLNNGIKFIKSLENCVVASQNEKDIANKYIEILYKIDQLSSDEPEGRRYKHQFWSVNRLILLKSLLVFGESELDRINECIYRTVTIFVEMDCAKFLDEKAAVSWNENVFVTLQLLNKMEQNMFLECFKKSAKYVVEMVTAKSLDVRKQIGFSLKRKLI
ncbi:Sec7 domain containing protein [Tritrichomonas foetus]|uniref:Sec7 domain containing protein n=1 Tax=Tritrichomonas foetus TaxID=1144522 RepID=A0A1J4JHF8_9EUKA|nr:Sec7 domain containing protein [Tritrichomonas foetus]|eukprot:OHS98584.1 Sec7 domain containing protein [Tritrichomonas foetus]